MNSNHPFFLAAAQFVNSQIALFPDMQAQQDCVPHIREPDDFEPADDQSRRSNLLRGTFFVKYILYKARS
jgi:hypothetical protein